MAAAPIAVDEDVGTATESQIINEVSTLLDENELVMRLCNAQKMITDGEIGVQDLEEKVRMAPARQCLKEGNG